jgi:hypothetical protein
MKITKEFAQEAVDTGRIKKYHSHFMKKLGGNSSIVVELSDLENDYYYKDKAIDLMKETFRVETEYGGGDEGHRGMRVESTYKHTIYNK